MTSLSEIATNVYGRVGEFRRVLDFNPQELPFELPPQIEAGIDRASEVLNLPSASELREVVGDRVENVLGGLRSRLSGVLDEVEASEETVMDVINRIDWLL